MKKKGLIIGIIVLIVLLILTGAAFAYIYFGTDLLKSDKELFAKYTMLIGDDEEGFSHYFGHANVSAYLFLTDLLSQKEVHNKDFFLDIALMIEFHDYIFSFDMDFKRMKERFSARFSGLSDEFWEALRLLTIADRIRPESA